MRPKGTIGKFIEYYKPHWKLFYLDIACALIIAIIDLTFPMVTRFTLQNYLPNQEYHLFFYVLIGMGIAYIIRGGLEYVINYWGHMLGVRMEYDMRRDLFTHLQTLSFNFFDKHRTGRLMSRMINDLFEIAELAHHGPEDLFLSAVKIFGSFILLLSIDWRLACILYAFIPFMVWFAIRQRVKMSLSFKDVKRKIADVNATLENSISGIRVAKSFANEEHEIEKFQEGNNFFKISKNKSYKYMGVFMSGIHLQLNLLRVITVLIGGVFIMKRQMDVADLFAFTLYITTFMEPIRRLTSFVQQFESGITGFERFQEILAVKPMITEKADAVSLKEVKGDIQLHTVSFTYDAKEEHVLKNINLHISPGKTLALVGPSGGGKTTLCHLIPRFYEVTEGKITLDGKDIRDLTIKSLRQNIGIVQQDVFLFAGTIRDNILYGNVQASEEEMIEAAKNANIHDFILSLPNGYDTEVGERGIRLSGGQKQRISIARVFLKNPPILILDEATSALDNETEIKIQKSLERLSKGRTTLVIAHRLSTIKDADEIVVLTDRGIEEQGSHEELLQQGGLYATLYQSQFRGYIPDEI